MSEAAMGEVTELLDKARAGEAGAWDRAVALVYQDLKRIARGVLAGSGSATLDATALVHECYERLARQEASGVTNRAHFLALAARAMRQLLLNHARDKVAAKRGAGAVHVDVDDAKDAAFAEARHLLELDSALTQLETENANWVRVVECRIFAGMTEQETADALEQPLRTSQRAFSEARARLAELLVD
jgi:RNA polymerase sigma factor (TIGR02999 family)